MKRNRSRPADDDERVIMWGVVVGGAILILAELTFGAGVLWLMWLGIKWLGAHT